MLKKRLLVLITNEFVKKFPLYFIILFFLALVQGGLSGVVVVSVLIFTDFLIDQSLSNPSDITQFILYYLEILEIKPNFLFFSTFFCVINFLHAFTDISIRYALIKIKFRILSQFSNQTFIEMLQTRWSFFSNSNQGKIVNTFHKELPYISDCFSHMTTFLALTIQMLIYLAIPFFLNLKMTLTAIAIAMVLSVPFILISKLSFNYGTKRIKANNDYASIINEILGAAKLVIGFGLQSVSSKSFYKVFKEFEKFNIKSHMISIGTNLLFKPMGILAAIIALGMAFESDIIVSELAAIMWSLMASIPIASRLLESRAIIFNQIPSYQQLLTIRKEAYLQKEIIGSKTFKKLKKGIQLENLNFTYPGRTKTLLDINLNIPINKVVAIVGESGSGKSTISDLILGLHSPDKGRVLLDNKPLDYWDINSFRQMIGYVPQESLLFNETIRNNLLWSNASATDKDIWSTLELSNAKLFVNEMPNGLDTLVGDRGVRLSGGQRQRIALARALIKNPELLILDEATSSLDTESEKLIQQSIEIVSKKCTVLVIAHRLSTISKADYIYVISKGKIIEEGTFSYLSQNSKGILRVMLMGQKVI